MKLRVKVKPVEATPPSEANRVQRAKCSVSGAVHLMLRVCQCCGVAPVRFERRRAVRSVCVSPALSAWSWMAVTALNIAAVTGLIIDLNIPLRRSNRVGTPTRRIVWISDFAIVILNMSIAVYKAPRRLNEVLSCLDQIQKIKVTYGRISKSWEFRNCIILIICLILAVLILSVDYWTFIKEIEKAKKDRVVANLYSCYFIGFLIIFIMEAQFVTISVELYGAFKNLNNFLEDIGYLIKKQDNLLPNSVLISNNYMHNFPVNSVSKVVDSMMPDHNYKRPDFELANSSKTVAETLRHVALTHDQLCVAMKRLNVCFGPELFCFISSCFLHLVITPYNLYLTIANKEKDLSAVLMQALWCLWHFYCTVAAVEPGNMIQLEMDRTHSMLSHLQLHNKSDLVQAELVKFSRSLLLNKVEYSPMGACTLSRPLVISMLGSIATYLVIIIQFQTSESGK